MRHRAIIAAAIVVLVVLLSRAWFSEESPSTLHLQVYEADTGDVLEGFSAAIVTKEQNVLRPAWKRGAATVPRGEHQIVVFCPGYELAWSHVAVREDVARTTFRMRRSSSTARVSIDASRLKSRVWGVRTAARHVVRGPGGALLIEHTVERDHQAASAAFEMPLAVDVSASVIARSTSGHPVWPVIHVAEPDGSYEFHLERTRDLRIRHAQASTSVQGAVCMLDMIESDVDEHRADALRLWRLDLRAIPIAENDGSVALPSMPLYPFHLAYKVDGIWFYRQIHGMSSPRTIVVDADRAPLPRTILVSTEDVPDDALIFSGRVDLEFINAAGKLKLLDSGLAVRVSTLRALGESSAEDKGGEVPADEPPTLTPSEWLTIWSPSRGTAFLRWNGERAIGKWRKQKSYCATRLRTLRSRHMFGPR